MDTGISLAAVHSSIIAKYTGVPPHRLRHTFAYDYLRANNNDLVALADILGHESLNTTRNYTRRRMEDLEDGVENVRYEKRERREK